jgi:hypothetical protein
LVARFAGVDVLTDFATLDSFVILKALGGAAAMARADGAAGASDTTRMPAIAAKFVALTRRILADSPDAVLADVGASCANTCSTSTGILEGAAVAVVAGQRVGREDATLVWVASVVGTGV